MSGLFSALSVVRRSASSGAAALDSLVVCEFTRNKGFRSESVRPLPLLRDTVAPLGALTGIWRGHHAAKVSNVESRPSMGS